MGVVLFNSLSFWVFCVVVVTGSYLTPRRFRWLWLLSASYVFYGSFGLPILGVLVGLTAWVYGVSRAMDRASGPARRLLLLADIGVPLAALTVFKYLTLFWQAIQWLAGLVAGGGQAEPFNILVPIGISFYVFKLLSYAIDTYRRRIPAETHVGYFALYVSYFPQILAGPIERPGELLPQLRRPVVFDPMVILAGTRLVAWGLFKKMVVADRLAYYVDEAFRAPQYKSLHLLFAAYFYYVQIYCDFSGYSDISTGISRLLGLTPPVNFNYPYLSRSVSEFWTRWHMTLSSWLRDYLFLPIAYGVMRRVSADRWAGITVEAWGYGVGTFATMALAGLWHGAAWTMVAWGALHGVYQIVSAVTRKVRRRWCRVLRLNRVPRLHAALKVLITFNLVTFAWILFRATSFEHATMYIRYFQFKLPSIGLANLLFDLAVVGVFFGMEYVQRHRARFVLLDRVPLEIKAIGYALFVTALIAFSVAANNPFIYFSF
jgi:alginate O-acetyltransferase complex protein AlgI